MHRRREKSGTTADISEWTGLKTTMQQEGLKTENSGDWRKILRAANPFFVLSCTVSETLKDDTITSTTMMNTLHSFNCLMLIMKRLKLCTFLKENIKSHFFTVRCYTKRGYATVCRLSVRLCL